MGAGGFAAAATLLLLLLGPGGAQEAPAPPVSLVSVQPELG